MESAARGANVLGLLVEALLGVGQLLLALALALALALGARLALRLDVPLVLPVQLAELGPVLDPLGDLAALHLPRAVLVAEAAPLDQVPAAIREKFKKNPKNSKKNFFSNKGRFIKIQAKIFPNQ